MKVFLEGSEWHGRKICRLGQTTHSTKKCSVNTRILVTYSATFSSSNSTKENRNPNRVNCENYYHFFLQCDIGPTACQTVLPVPLEIHFDNGDCRCAATCDLQLCQLSSSFNHRSIFGRYFVCRLLTLTNMAEEEVAVLVVDNGSGMCKAGFDLFSNSKWVDSQGFLW